MKVKNKVGYSSLKTCVVCGRKIKITHYPDRTYAGGYYFGEIPLFTKKEMKRAHQAGTRKSKIGTLTVDVMKKDPKPYSYAEYWECQKCYES